MAFIHGSSWSKSKGGETVSDLAEEGMSGLVVLLLTLVVTCMGNA